MNLGGKLLSWPRLRVLGRRLPVTPWPGQSRARLVGLVHGRLLRRGLDGDELGDGRRAHCLAVASLQKSVLESRVLHRGVG